MSISRVVNNIAAINSTRNLDKTQRSLSKSVERLSSGLRINRAGDDAAGLVVANRLRTQVQGMDQAITNASDGINLINVAEGALEETTIRLNRIRQLTIQAANTAVNDISARRAIQDEVFQSIDEITRIANTTQYTSNHLLNGDFSIQSDMIGGQPEIGVSIDASPVASTLAAGKSFLNITKTQDGFAQIIAGDEVGGNQVLNTGIQNGTDIAVTLSLFTDSVLFGTPTAAGAQVLQTTTFFNGISIGGSDTFVFEGVLADGKTQFVGTFSVGAAGSVNNLMAEIQTAISNTEMALFGVDVISGVPNDFHTTVTLGSGSNAGRFELHGQGEFINQSSVDLTLVRADYVVSRAAGVTRSGSIGIDSGISGTGQVGNSVGNSIEAITGSTYERGQFEIVVQDVQAAQQRKVENTIIFRDGNGSVIDRSVSLGGAGTRALTINGSFVEGAYTGGTTLISGDMITLTGLNSDGSTFQGTYTFQAIDAGTTEPDTALNDFRFGTISGLVEELNYRSRDYAAGSGTADGVQTRFEDATFTFSLTGTMMLRDDIGKSNSETNFTMTFQRDPTNTGRANYTFQDGATLLLEGFAEQATFSIAGGEEIRAEAGDVITLKAAEATRAGVPQSQVTLRIGSGLVKGADKLESTPDEYVGTLNGGQVVTFGSGAQDVVFIDGTSGGTKGTARFVTVDFDENIDVTARTDGLPDAGYTLILSTQNASLNFQIGAYEGQSFRAAIGDLTAENLGFGFGSSRTVSDIDVTSIEGANEALKILDEALGQVDKTRSILGAATNRLEATISNLSVSVENMTASESRIRDADIARETTQFTKNQVMMLAGISVLAQANFQSQAFLSLIG